MIDCKIRTSILFSCLLFLFFGVFFLQKADAQVFSKYKGPYLGQKPPGDTAEVFAPDLVFDDFPHGSPVFTPGGKEVYFPGIYYMKEINGRWTSPKPAPFSIKSEVNPTISSDGKRICFFRAYRPNIHKLEAGTCVVEKNEGKWGEPKLIDSRICSIPKGWQTSISDNGSIYFSTSKFEGFGSQDLFKVELKNGNYSDPVNLGNELNSKSYDMEPFVSPDEKYIIFSSGRPEGTGEEDLYVSFKNKNGNWGKPVNLGDRINSKETDMWPNVSTDGKYLFFLSTRNDKPEFYWVDAKVIEDLRIKQTK